MSEESKPATQDSKEVYFYRLFFALAEQMAKFALTMDQILDEYNKVAPAGMPLGNPINKAYREIMEIATDARLGDCKVACNQANRAMMERMLIEKQGTLL